MTSVLTSLRESATPALYRRNIFRVTGLPTDADRPTVRRRRQKVLTLLEVGALPESDADPQDVARAFDLVLSDPRRRLVDELFWLWDTDTSACGCPSTLHVDHDEAVLSHSEALDREVRSAQLSAGELRDLDEDWEAAATEWASVVRRVAFWDHVRHRIDALDDKQLDESALDVIRDELPIVLVKPMTMIAGGTGVRGPVLRRAALEHPWPVERADVLDLLELAAEPLYEEVGTAARTARDTLDRGRAADAAQALSDDAVPPLERLSALAPPDEHRRTARLRDEIAIGFNNCAVRHIDDVGASGETSARRWLTTAKGLTSDPETLSTIAANTEYVGQVVLASRYPRARQPQPSSAQGCVGCLVWLVLIGLGVLFLWWVSR